MYELKWSDRNNIRDISESNIIDNNNKSDINDIIHRGDSSDRSYTIVDNLYTYIAKDIQSQGE